MKILLGLVVAMFAALLVTGCSVVTATDKVYDAGVKAYEMGEKVHDGLEKAGVGAKKVGEVYVNIRGEKEDDVSDSKSMETGQE